MAVRGRQRRAAGVAYSTTTPVRESAYNKSATAGIGKQDLTPQRYPMALSHDSAFHETLRHHITSLRNRFDELAPETKKSGTAWSGMKARLDAHLDAAEAELNNSYAAHKHGHGNTNAAALAATNSFHRSATHLADAYRFILSEQGAGPKPKRHGVTGEVITDESGEARWARKNMAKLGSALVNRDTNTGYNPPSTGQLDSLVHDYHTHVYNAVEKKVSRDQIPTGLAEAPHTDFNPFSDISEVGRAALAPQGFKLSAQEEIVSAAKAKNAKKIKRDQARRDRDLRAGRTHTLGSRPSSTSGQVGRQSVIPVPTGSGQRELLSAVHAHFSRTYPGQQFYGSEAHRDPVSYAAKHEVSLPSQTAMIGKSLKRLGLDSSKDPSPTQILDSKLDFDPRDRASKKEAQLKVENEAGQAPAVKTTAFDAGKKPGRNAVFSEAKESGR